MAASECKAIGSRDPRLLFVNLTNTVSSYLEEKVGRKAVARHTVLSSYERAMSRNSRSGFEKPSVCGKPSR